MISLNMRLTAQPGKEQELESAITDRWIVAMSEHPGFIQAVMLKQYSPEKAAKLGLPEREYTYDVISLWESEEQRLAWQVSEMHAEVIASVNDSVTSTGKEVVLNTVVRSWNI